VPGARLLVAGEGGSFRETIAKEARAQGIEEALLFTGWLDGAELKEAYAAADVVASPSLCFESFNLINLEAMAMGKPVVSSFFGGPSEVVEDGVTGLLVNPLDEDGLAAALGRILEDAALAERMGAAARQRAKDLFDIKKTGQALHALYGSLIKGNIGS